MSDDKNIKWAEVNRLGYSSDSNTPVTKDNLPKEGDRVRCAPGFIKSNECDSKSGGSGYKTGKIIIVGSISNLEGRVIIWPNEGGYGIYFDALEFI